MFGGVEETYVGVEKGGRDSGVEEAAGVGARQEGMKGEPVHGCRHNNVYRCWEEVESEEGELASS
jgi:hypothetical protein